MNKVILHGRLGADPIYKSLEGEGKAVLKFNLATNEFFKKDGVKQDKVTWHRVVLFNNKAESCRDYLSKGSEVLIDGKLENRKWTDEETKEEKNIIEVIVKEIKFISGCDKKES